MKQTDMFATKTNSYTLRPYQDEAATEAVKNLMAYGKPFVIQAATGAGKSLIIAEVCHRLNQPTLILQPSKELLEQNYAKLESYGVDDIAIYSASLGQKEIAKYTYATIGSIYKKPELFKDFKYVIVDECHVVNPKNLSGMYTTFLNAIGCQNVCGLTATPYRLQQKFFKRGNELVYTSHLKMLNRIHPFFFKKIAYKIETDQLIEMGYLSPIVYRTPEDVSYDELQVNTTGRDFTEESLERFWNEARMRKLASVIQKIDEHCQRSLIFCSSLRHAGRTQQLLEAIGIPSAIVSGKTPKIEREKLVARYRAGEFKHMINVGVFTTGFDVPELDCIILARPTMSLALYYQMVGRGVRKDPERPDKVLRVYDLAGVSSKLGRVETIKLAKEDGWKDMVVSEVGRMDEKPLFEFIVKNKEKKARFS